MKKIHIQKTVLNYIIKNKWQLALVFFSLVIGTAAGSVFSVLMKTDQAEAMTKYLSNFVSAYNLQSVSGKDIFYFSLYNNIKVTLFLWLSGIWLGFMPLGILQIGIKGYKIGFSTTLFVKVFGVKGIFFALFSLIPQLLIMIPALITYCVFNINFAVCIHQIKSQKVKANVKNEICLKNLLYLLAVVAISVISAILDAFVVPPILKPICSFLGN